MNKGLIAYFAENRVAANLLMVFLIIGGLLMASQLSVKLFPKINLHSISITVPSPGSTPEEIEEDINRRLEESIIGLSGVDRVVSVASQGIGRVRIEVDSFASVETVLDDVKSALFALQNFPPVSAERPIVTVDIVELEVMTLAVSSDSAEENELRLIAEDVRSDLLELPGVSYVSLHGVRDREITIELNEEDLRRHNLTFAEISRKINRNSRNLSFGELRSNSGNIVLNSISKRNTGKEFEDIPLITRLNGTLITLGDVATVRDGFADYEVRSELNGNPAVFVRVDADDNQSITKISRAIESWLSQKSFPDHVEVSVWNDRAGPTVERLRKIISNGLIGLILVLLCLVVVFDLRVAIWVTVGIPVSFVGALLFFDVANLTVNLGTVFAFFLLIGVVVDDAVVVGENIVAERQRGKNALDAAISGARGVVAPIVVGVVTTAIAFTPLLFITEERYQMLAVVPFVVFFVLLVSLVEAFWILPAHLSHEKRLSLSPLRELQDYVSQRIDYLRDQIIAPIVSWSVVHYYRTLIIGAAVVVASLLLINFGVVRVILIDHTRHVSDSVQADIYYPAGTSFSATSAAAERIAQAARNTDSQVEGDSIKSISLIAGAPVMELITPTDAQKENSSHIASVRVHLNDTPVRKISIAEFERAWRRNISDASTFERLEIRSTRFQTVPSVAYSLRHPDRSILQSAAIDFRALLDGEPGIYGLTDNMNLGMNQFAVELSPEGRLAGLTPVVVGQQLRAGFHGLEVQRIQRGKEEIRVVVRYPREQRRVPNALEVERLLQVGGSEIPLSYATEITESRELASLARINGEKTAFVNGYADVTIATPIQLRRKISNAHIPELLQKYPGLRIEADGVALSEAKILKVLIVVVPLVLLVMYALVAAFLRSYWKPLIVVFGIPVAFAGAIISHWVLGWDFTAMSIFGVLGVSGVVVNDALVLLDRYNNMRRHNPDLPAIVAASGAMQHRFRAVFLTSLTTILGLSPMIYERSETLLNTVPFVVSMLGGLIFAGLFTLFLLPTMVMLIEGRKE